MCVADILRKIALLCAVTIPQFDIKKYLDRITEEDSESNYRLFKKAANSCSSDALAIVFCLGHFGGDVRLLNIVGEIITCRLVMEKKEDGDISDYIAHLLMHYHRQRALGKYISLIIITITKNVVNLKFLF